MKPTKEQILVALKQIEKFSPAPVILANAMQLLRDPRADIASIAALVTRDSALVADIVRCANSVYYGGATSSNIGEAVQKIGVRETMRLLNLAVARIVGGRDLNCYGISGADYWAESLFNGLFMQAVAKKTGATDPEEAYTTGLLRFVGRLAIDQTLVNLRAGHYWSGGESISKWELNTVGLIQSEVGAMLLGNWHFPAHMVEAVAAQYAPAKLAVKNQLAEALNFASALLPQGVGTPFLPALGITWIVLPGGKDFMRRHDLNPDAIDLLLNSTSESFDEIRANFEG